MSNLRKNLQRKRRIARRRKNRENGVFPGLRYEERRDPIESDPAYKEIFRAVKSEAEKMFLDYKGTMGFCHLYWGTMQGILRTRYGIEWKTPAQMNPDTLYD